MGAGAGAQTYADTEKEGGGAPQQQHAGLGRRLLQWAERLAWEAGFRRVAIISGVGVRRYYARLGSSARPLSLSARLEPLYTKPLSDRLFPLSSRAAESTGSALAAHWAPGPPSCDISTVNCASTTTDKWAHSMRKKITR